MSADYQKKSNVLALKPMLGPTFAHRPNQRIELQRNPSNNITTALVWKNLLGKSGIVTYRVDEDRGIVEA